jgi:hypothetical protein
MEQLMRGTPSAYPSSSSRLVFTTTELTRPPSGPVVCFFHSGIESRTLASITESGWTVLGLRGRGKLSDIPVLGGLNAELGKVGKFFSLLRAPTPGEGGKVGRAAIGEK